MSGFARNLAAAIGINDYGSGILSLATGKHSAVSYQPSENTCLATLLDW